MSDKNIKTEERSDGKDRDEDIDDEEEYNPVNECAFWHVSYLDNLMFQCLVFYQNSNIIFIFNIILMYFFREKSFNCFL